MLEIHSTYLEPVFNPKTLNKIIKAMINIIKESKIRFGTIACTGVSGLLIAPIIARELNKSLCVIRKTSDGSHYQKYDSDETFEGAVPNRYVFIDDLIRTGATLFRVLDEIGYQNPKAKCVGIFLYREDDPYMMPEFWFKARYRKFQFPRFFGINEETFLGKESFPKDD